MFDQGLSDACAGCRKPQFPSKDRQARFGVRLPIAPVNEFAFQRSKETLRHDVVIGVADGSHARTHTHFFAAFAKCHRRAGCLDLNDESPIWACV